jgi:Coenzyme PQQ synthesis protein D (PqqD)
MRDEPANGLGPAWWRGPRHDRPGSPRGGPGKEAYVTAGPRGRRDGLVVKTLGSEVLVYDLEGHRAYSLNALAAAIWRGCDGRPPVASLAAAVRAETGVPVTDAAVEYGLALARARLLAAENQPVSSLTRRRTLGGLAAAAVPVVLSVVAPTAAQAQSCAHESDPCPNGDVDCCPGESSAASMSSSLSSARTAGLIAAASPPRVAGDRGLHARPLAHRSFVPQEHAAHQFTRWLLKDRGDEPARGQRHQRWAASG